MYKPLPNYLTIRVSGIEGLGLFTTAKIKKGTDLGVSHIPDPGLLTQDYENGYIRTPLGGFINHSDNPNVIKIDKDWGRLHLIATRDIDADEEITVKYTLYSINLKRN